MKTREELFNRIWQMGLGNGTIDDDEIQGILNLPTQAQLDCPYCHEPFLDLSGKTENELDQFDPDGAYCGLDKDSTITYGSPGDGFDGGYGSIKIHYCPMCGRRMDINETSVNRTIKESK